MKSNLCRIVKYLFFLSLFISFNSFGQVVFEKGYFIDNNDKKTECLIKNYEWKVNPSQIEYKLTEQSESKTESVVNLKEFSVSNLKYRRHTVMVDQSGKTLSTLSEDKDPIFSEETLFLKVIIEGKASLYIGGKYERYFYHVNNSEVKQLIHKEYILDARVFTNNSFKTQLWTDLSCDCIKVTDIEKTKYKKKYLIKIFEKYNACFDDDFINYDVKAKKIDFNLNIRPGIRLSTLEIKNLYNNALDINFGRDLSFYFGIESELVLPINKNKWAIMFEPTFQYYRTDYHGRTYKMSVDYKSVELPVGIKYNIFLSTTSKISLTGSVLILDIPINSSIASMEINSTNNFYFGLGYSFKNKYSIEVKYGLSRTLLSRYAYYRSNYQSLSVIFGYNIF